MLDKPPTLVADSFPSRNIARGILELTSQGNYDMAEDNKKDVGIWVYLWNKTD